MGKYKVGDIVSVRFEKFILSCRIYKEPSYDSDFYKVKSLETNYNITYGQTLKALEGNIRLVQERDPEIYNDFYSKTSIEKSLIRTQELMNESHKKHKDFIYFKDKGFIMPKKVLKDNPITINEVVILNKNDLPKKPFLNGFGVYSNNCQLKDFETREEAKEFLKTLSELLESDVL